MVALKVVEYIEKVQYYDDPAGMLDGAMWVSDVQNNSCITPDGLILCCPAVALGMAWTNPDMFRFVWGICKSNLDFQTLK